MCLLPPRLAASGADGDRLTDGLDVKLDARLAVTARQRHHAGESAGREFGSVSASREAATCPVQIRATESANAGDHVNHWLSARSRGSPVRTAST
jgi:hypothetical protein